MVDDGARVEAELLRGQASDRRALLSKLLLHLEVPGEKASVPSQVQIQVMTKSGQRYNYVIRVRVSSPRDVHGALTAAPASADSVVRGQVRLLPGQQPGDHFICLQLRLGCGEKTVPIKQRPRSTKNIPPDLLTLMLRECCCHVQLHSSTSGLQNCEACDYYKQCASHYCTDLSTLLLSEGI